MCNLLLFQASYKPTVEDLYSQDFQIGEHTLRVDLLDTAGDDQFPVMRRLSIRHQSLALGQINTGATQVRHPATSHNHLLCLVL